MRTSDPAVAALQLEELATPLTSSRTEMMTVAVGAESEHGASSERALTLVVTPAADARPLPGGEDATGDAMSVTALPVLAASLERTAATLWASPVQMVELLQVANAQRRLLDTIAIAYELGAAHLPASLAADLAVVRGNAWPQLLTTPPGPLALSS